MLPIHSFRVLDMPKYTVVDAVELRSQSWVKVMIMARFMSLKYQKSRDRFGYVSHINGAE
jgi:hypothetical protein